MRFDTVIDSRDAKFGSQVRAMAIVFLIFLPVFIISQLPSFAQKSPADSEPPEMLVTEQGFLAISTPKGWTRANGPGLAYFVPEEETKGELQAWIYISSAPIGPDEDAKDLKSYIESDITDFKQRFKEGVVQKEDSLNLPYAKLEAPVYTFRSGEKRNTVEQVVYVGESNRVLTLVLSAREKPAFEKALPVFRDFARSYRGSITTTPSPA
jgi:hypothetical protein